MSNLELENDVPVSETETVVESAKAKFKKPQAKVEEPEAIAEEPKAPAKSKAKKESRYTAWWNEHGESFISKGLGQRNILLKAARAAGTSFDEAMIILGGEGTTTEKLLKIFKE
jgi:hypothetical protein